MCGIFGVFGPERAAEITHLGLYSLQHRGQESAGIVAVDGDSVARGTRKMGLVGEGLSAKEMESLAGRIAIGHTRYSTAGSSTIENAQPVLARFKGGHIALAHNGNLTNALEIRAKLEDSGSIFASTMDSEVIVHRLARATEGLPEHMLAEALRGIDGAYCLVVAIGETLLAARDPRGWRPLVVGSLGDGYVMRRLEGETIPRKLMRDDRFAGARKVLIDECARALAAIHRTPVSELPLAPAPSVTSQLDTLESLHRGFGVPVPTFSLVFRWLRSRIPPARESALVHGDFRTGNLLVDERGLAAVLDWELVHLGDPLEDLGWFCVPAWRFGSPLPAGGFGDRASFFAAYERAAGGSVDPDHARFWEVFGTLRWGVICQWQAFAHLEGRAPSVERAAIGRRVTEVELDLLLLLEGKL